jgi:hypothetical protein
MKTNRRYLNQPLLFTILVVGIFLMNIVNTRSEMYQWERLTDLPYDVKTMEFASAAVGWRVDALPEDHVDGGTQAAGSCRLLSTANGGKTWNVIYQTNDRIYKIRYMRKMKCLLAIMLEKNPELKRKLYKSTDGGHTWNEVCLFPFPAQGVYFFNEKDGYAWGSNSLYGTYDSAKTWHPIAETRFSTLEHHEQMQIIGKNRSIFFIEHQRVYALNFWDGNKITLPLPVGFEPEAVIAKSSGSKVYVFGKLSDKWTFLEFENNQLILTETVPIKEKEFQVSSFAYGNHVINLVGSTRGAVFLTYYFYRRDTDGWHKESISGTNNYSLFSYWGDNVWTVRVSLRHGTRELFFRNAPE